MSNIGAELLLNERRILTESDHKHLGDEEIEYVFTTAKALLDDFWKDVDNWRF